MNTNEQPIFSSIGSLGVTRRQDGRLYVNATEFSADPIQVLRNFRRLREIGNRHPARIGRVVFRGLIGEEVLAAIMDSDLPSNLEVLLPMDNFAQTGFLAYLASNRFGRTPIVSSKEMVCETNRYSHKNVEPVDHIQSLSCEGYRFTDQVEQSDIGRLHDLWGPTFGWSLKEVANLAKRIEIDRQQSPEARGIWIVLVRNGTEIVSAAMAERLTIPGRKAPLELVENTEWCTRSGYAGRGLITAALVVLNAQVLRDMRHLNPLIFAECNFQTRSDVAGHKAGFRIPDRAFAPQILVQNVGVNDGQLLAESGRLRDFTFMYLPQDIVEGRYSPEQAEATIASAQIF